MKFKIKIRVNPFDEWKTYKVFKDKKRAEQSLKMLRKHTYNLDKGTNYTKYKLVEVIQNGKNNRRTIK